jgi:hypothetical protein
MLVSQVACNKECQKHSRVDKCKYNCDDTYYREDEQGNGSYYSNKIKGDSLPWICQDAQYVNGDPGGKMIFPNLNSLFGITAQNPDHPKQLGLQQDYSQEVTDKSGLAVQQNLDIINSQDQIDNRTATKRILIRQKVGATPGEPSTLQSEEIEHEYVNDMDIKMKTQY